MTRKSLDYSATLSEEVGIKFGNMIKGLKNCNTPGTQNLHIIGCVDNSDNISTQDQKLYQPVVGMLLYLVKCFCPDIPNSVKELSKIFDHAYLETLKEMLFMIKFVLDTKNYGLKFQTKLGYK